MAVGDYLEVEDVAGLYVGEYACIAYFGTGGGVAFPVHNEAVGGGVGRETVFTHCFGSGYGCCECVCGSCGGGIEVEMSGDGHRGGATVDGESC